MEDEEEPDGAADKATVEPKTVKIGDVEVPAAFADRWNELLKANRTLKANLQESSAALTLAQEEAATGSTAALTAAQARIAELEGQVEGSAWSVALAEDGLGADDDTVEYLKYQYGKLAPADGEEKPSVKDWYTEFREKSTVVQAARKVVETVKGETNGKGKKADEPNGKAAPAKIAASTRPEKPAASVTPKPIAADTDALTTEKVAAMDPRDFAANRENVRRQLFGS